MKNLLKGLIALLFAVSAAVSSGRSQTVSSVFFFDSSPNGRYDGATSTVNTINGNTIDAAYFHDVSGHNEAIFFINGNDMGLTIGLPLGEDFVKGQTYKTEPIPLDPSSDAGYKLQFGISAISGSFANTYTAEVSGWFKVLDYSAVTGASHITSMAVDYYQVDSSGNWNYGSLRYNSTVPINTTYDVSIGYIGSAIPEPTTYAAIAGAAVLLVAFLSRRKSVQTI